MTNLLLVDLQKLRAMQTNAMKTTHQWVFQTVKP